MCDFWSSFCTSLGCAIAVAKNALPTSNGARVSHQTVVKLTQWIHHFNRQLESLKVKILKVLEWQLSSQEGLRSFLIKIEMNLTTLHPLAFFFCFSLVGWLYKHRQLWDNINTNTTIGEEMSTSCQPQHIHPLTPVTQPGSNHLNPSSLWKNWKTNTPFSSEKQTLSWVVSEPSMWCQSCFTSILLKTWTFFPRNIVEL